jgi:hypothetical protein
MIIQRAKQYSGKPVLTKQGKPWKTGWIMITNHTGPQHFPTLKACKAAWHDICQKNEEISWNFKDMFDD